MPAIDVNTLFPNSMKAGAVKRGQSRFRSMQAIGAGGAPSVTPTTWNPADSIRTTFSSGNLTATTTASNNGSVRALVGNSSGKYFWELTNTSNQTTDFAGLAASSVSLSIAPNRANTCGLDGLVRFWVGTSALFAGGSISPGNLSGTTAFAVDLTAKLFWIKPAGGNWTGSSLTANPATGLNGADISSLTFPLFPFSTMVLSGVTATANFGGSAFSNTVPTGFAAGWG